LTFGSHKVLLTAGRGMLPSSKRFACSHLAQTLPKR